MGLPVILIHDIDEARLALLLKPTWTLDEVSRSRVADGRMAVNATAINGSIVIKLMVVISETNVDVIFVELDSVFNDSFAIFLRDRLIENRFSFETKVKKWR